MMQVNDFHKVTFALTYIRKLARKFYKAISNIHHVDNPRKLSDKTDKS